MSIRVTDQEVKEIFDTTIDTSPFIIAASKIIDNKLSTKFSEEVLKEIERWLAAHFVCARDPRAISETVGNTSINYSGSYGLGLDSTHYGQMVKILDSSGTLANLGKKIARIDTIQAMDITA